MMPLPITEVLSSACYCMSKALTNLLFGFWVQIANMLLVVEFKFRLVTDARAY